MTIKIPRKYMMTWAVFFFLLSVILVVFAVTRAANSPKVKGTISYEQLLQKVQTSPTDIEELTIVNNEPIAIAKIKGDALSKQIMIREEDKASLLQELQKAEVPFKSAPPDESSSWWEIRMPGLSVGGP